MYQLFLPGAEKLYNITQAVDKPGTAQESISWWNDFKHADDKRKTKLTTKTQTKSTNATKTQLKLRNTNKTQLKHNKNKELHKKALQRIVANILMMNEHDKWSA